MVRWWKSRLAASRILFHDLFGVVFAPGEYVIPSTKEKTTMKKLAQEIRNGWRDPETGMPINVD